MSRSRRATLCRGSIPLAPIEQQCLRQLAEETHRRKIVQEERDAERARRAHDRDSTPGRASATGFAEWVFWQCNPHYTPPARGPASTILRWSGEYGHEQIQRLHFCLSRDRRIGPLVRARRGWTPVYIDAPDRGDQRFFAASRLRVDGQPVAGRPDVVLRDRESGDVIILERKVLHRAPQHMPSDGYANHWCQLWCYGWMDAWADVPNVLLVLQYWRRDWNVRPLAIVHSIAPVRLCRSPAFHAWAMRWFEQYGGRFRS